MLGHQNNDETDSRARPLTPLMSLFRKIKPKRRHGSGSPEVTRVKMDRPRNRKRDSGTSSLDSEVVAYTEEIQESRLTASSMSSDVVLKPPGNKEIVSLISEKSREGDGMLRVTSDRWDVKGRQGEDLFKVDCSGQYDDPGTKFLWYKPKPTVEEHENCLGAYLNAEDPTKKFPTTGSVEQQYPFRLCCHKMKDGKIHLAAHKAPTGAKDSEGLLYVCKLQERSGIITLQENVSHSDKPLAGSFIGATNTGQVKMFPPSLFEPYTGNPFAYFYLMDLDDEKTESMKRMNGEK